MADEKNFKNPPFGVIGHRVYPSWSKPSRNLKPGTIKKAMSFVDKADKDNPHWKNAEKKIKDMFSGISSVGEQQGLQPRMAKAQFPEKDVRIVKPDLKPELKPEAKAALKDWYKGVYKKGGQALGYTGFKNKAEYDAYVKGHKNMDKPLAKSFSYKCPGCGHSDTVGTSGFGIPKEWPCRSCNKKTSDIKVNEEKPSPRMTDGQWKKYKATEKPLFTEHEKTHPFPKLEAPKKSA